MCDPISITVAAVGAIGAKKSMDAQKDAAKEAKKAREAEAKRVKAQADAEKTNSDEDFRAERKRSYTDSARRTRKPATAGGFAESRSFFSA